MLEPGKNKRLMTTVLEHSLASWPELSQVVFVPRTAEEYDRLVALLDELLDEVGNDESHPLASLMDVIGTLIERYEDEYLPPFDESSEKVGG